MTDQRRLCPRANDGSWIGKLLAACLFFVLSGAANADERPNIILCMGDDHGWEETGYNGHPDLKTPVLDEMAATALRLDHFYAAHPSCSPTRGSVLTGRHPNRYGTFAPNYSMRPEETTIAAILAKAGYACGHFGKWHLGPVKTASPTNPGRMGFQKWLSHDNFFELNPSLSRNGGPPEAFRGESSEIIVDETIRFIDEAKQNKKPFFAVVWFGSPHEPYSGLPDDLALYDDLPAKYAERTVRLTSNETGKPTQRKLRDVVRERFAEITAMDRALGKLREHLKDTGLRDNTLLWYCGDNGTPSSGLVASPFRGQKGQMYEGGIRVPGLIEWPGKIKKPLVSKVNAVTSDMLPTICAITGQPLPNRALDGVNLAPMFRGEMNSRDKPICFWSFKPRAAAQKVNYIKPELQKGTTPLVKLMRGEPTRTFRNFVHPKTTAADYQGARVLLDNEYKLVVHDGKDGNVELFHLPSDMAERTNLAAKHPERTAEMQQALREWQTSVLSSLTGADYKR